MVMTRINLLDIKKKNVYRQELHDVCIRISWSMIYAESNPIFPAYTCSHILWYSFFFFFFYLYKFILTNEFCAYMHVIDKKTSDGVDAC
jgi:hypothetical protein